MKPQQEPSHSQQSTGEAAVPRAQPQATSQIESQTVPQMEPLTEKLTDSRSPFGIREAASAALAGSQLAAVATQLATGRVATNASAAHDGASAPSPAAATAAGAEEASLLAEDGDGLNAPSVDHAHSGARSRLPGNASAVLQQARAGMATVLREVRSCRAARQTLREQLDACERASAAARAADASEDVALHSESRRCLGQLQAARDSLASRTKELSDERLRADGLTSAATRQIGALKASAAKAARERDACSASLAAAQKSGGAAEAQQAAVQAQLGVLRRKLEQKEQLEDAIEGKHSKLTEVYRALESECQAELAKLKKASAADGGGAGAVGAQAASASATDGAERAAGGCTASSLLASDARLLLVAVLAGGLGGWAARGRLGRPRRGVTAASSRPPPGAAVEEMRGWMPAGDYKIS